MMRMIKTKDIPIHVKHNENTELKKTWKLSKLNI